MPSQAQTRTLDWNINLHGFNHLCRGKTEHNSFAQHTGLLQFVLHLQWTCIHAVSDCYTSSLSLFSSCHHHVTLALLKFLIPVNKVFSLTLSSLLVQVQRQLEAILIVTDREGRHICPPPRCPPPDVLVQPQC